MKDIASFTNTDTSGLTTAWDNTVNSGFTGVGNISDPIWLAGETTANMQTQTTFTNAGWNFTTFWAMDGTTNDGYDYLQDNNPSGTVLSLTGGSNSDWNTSRNWSGGFVPSGSNKITIPTETNHPSISTAASINNMTIETGSVLTIARAGILTVKGTLSNSAGNSRLAIESTATRTGSLISSTTGVPATIHRYIDERSAWLKSIRSRKLFWKTSKPSTT